MNAKKQHYVPQFLLRNFSFDGKSVYVFDKQTRVIRVSAVREVAHENGFYDIAAGNEKLGSLEPALAKLDAMGANHIRRLCDERTIHALSREQKMELGYFIAAQSLRTNQFRNTLLAFARAVDERSQQLFPDSDIGIPRLDNRWAANQASRQLIMGLGHVAKNVLDKYWLLVTTSEDAVLFIGDTPVAMHNDFQFPPYGNIGLAVPGIQVFFPLSTRFCLMMLCRRLAAAIKTTSPSSALARVIEDGSTLEADSENVTFFNSCQVQFAERFVFCEKDEFGLIHQMLDEHPHMRGGFRPRMN